MPVPRNPLAAIAVRPKPALFVCGFLLVALAAMPVNALADVPIHAPRVGPLPEAFPDLRVPASGASQVNAGNLASDPDPDPVPWWALGLRGSLLPAPPGIVFGARPAEVGGQFSVALRPARLRGFEVDLYHQWLGTRSRPSFYPGGGGRVLGVLVEPPQRGTATARPEDPRGFLQVGVAWIEAGAPRLRPSDCPDGGGEVPGQDNSVPCPDPDEPGGLPKPTSLALTGGFGFDLPLRAGLRLRLDARLHVAADDDVWPDPSRYRPDVGVGVRWAF